MAAQLRYDWEAIRAEYEAGSTMGELSRKYGVTKGAISQRAKKERWLQDTTGVVNRLAQAKLNGVVNTLNPQKRAEALDNAAERKAAVLRRHRDEWNEHKALAMEAVATRDYDLARLAKITAETLKIRQDGERKAWGILEAGATEMSGGFDIRWHEG